MDRNKLHSNQLQTLVVACTALALTVMAGSGCGPSLPTAAELARFNNAGPSAPTGAEVNELLRARVPVGPYRVIPGDLLALEMPAVLRAIGDAVNDDESAIRRRIRSDGTIRLPGLDNDLAVKGLTTAQIELVAEEAYAKAVLRRPAVVVYVAGHRMVYASVAGRGVAQPGQYQLRGDELSLSALLMRAGGIAEQGASTITVWPGGDEGGDPLVLSLRDGVVPLQDVILQGGERIEVAPLAPAVMTITGQVTLPGRYYISRAAPPTLVDALAHARGVREAEDPRYVSVYRRDADGSMISARFRLNGNKGTTRVSLFHDNALGEGAFAQVKPGDVIVVERTFRSRVRQVLAGALRVSVGVSASTSATYHEDFQDTGAARAAGGGPEIITQNLLP